MVRPVDPPEVLQRFESTLELVEILARQVGKTVGSSVELDDLLSFGREGLLDAARRFDASRGVAFRSYANYRVRGAMIDGMRATSRLPRRTHERLNGMRAALSVGESALEDVQGAQPNPSAAEVALSEHLAAMATAIAMGLIATPIVGEEGELSPVDSDSPEDRLRRAQLTHIVESAVRELPPEEAELVRRHYFQGERFDQVAQELGLSKSWASRLHTRAIGRLSKRLRSAAA